MLNKGSTNGGQQGGRSSTSRAEEEVAEGGHGALQPGGPALQPEGRVMDPASMHCMTGEHSSEQRSPQELHVPQCSRKGRQKCAAEKGGYYSLMACYLQRPHQQQLTDCGLCKCCCMAGDAACSCKSGPELQKGSITNCHRVVVTHHLLPRLCAVEAGPAPKLHTSKARGGQAGQV